MDSHGHHPIAQFFLLMLGTVTGAASIGIDKMKNDIISFEQLERFDIISGIVLKWVSIISFLLVIILNWKKVRDRLFKK